ncbi:MAG: hypothetical protein FJ319_02665 [SAR202 cluster bacterium]|nr:hypothetical protein [SAR202 cluster bacterium]
MKKLPMLVVALGVLIASAGLTVLGAGIASAHASKDIGKYRLTVGFIVEPAYEGIKNGIDLRVRDISVDPPTNVTGVEQTIKVELIHVPSGTHRVFDLRTIYKDPGHYTADLMPTASGVYRMRFFGHIGEGADRVEINETFASRGEGGGFNDMQSSADLQFPVNLTEVREVESVVRGVQGDVASAQDAAIEAKDAANSANTMAIIGIVMGAIGIIVGAVAFGLKR